MAAGPVLDGALVNPFAHAVMQALAVLGAPVERWSRLYRARPIEVDDTAALRLTLAGGARCWSR